MRNVVITLFGVLIFVVGGVLLQIFPSKRESKWPGLACPSSRFCIPC